MAFSSKVRKNLLVQYGNKCSNCGYSEHPEILQAAHIVKHSENEDAKYVDIYLMVLLAGMASEEIIFNQHYTGSTSDLDKWYENALLLF